ncbi:MAG: hypothetical protein LWW97_00400 [Deltaproteobacteria bacterium]|nr:hypothetical protein [Deltaproteobacteria bacterium]
MIEITLKNSRSLKFFSWAGIVILQILFGVLYLVLGWQLFFTLVLLGVMAIVFVKKPEWSLYFLIFWVVIFWNTIGFLISDKAMFFGMNTMPIYMPLVLIGLACIGVRITARIQTPVNLGQSLNIPIFILYIYSLYTITWCTNLEYSLLKFAFFTFNILLYYYTCFMNFTEEIYKKCMWCWIFTGGIMSVMIIYSIIFHPAYYFTQNIFSDYNLIFRYIVGVDTRGYVVMHSNYSSFSLNAPIGIAIGLLIISKTRFQRFVLISFLILLMFANCLTFSKGGVGSGIIMIYFLIIGSSVLRKKAFFIIPVFTAIFIAIGMSSIAFANIFGYAIHAQFIESSGEIMSLAARLENWQHGLDLLLKKGLLLKGLGLGGFQQYTECLIHAHNLYLSIFFDFGLVGIGFGLSVLLIIAKMLFKNGIFSFFNQTTYYQTMRLVFTGIFIAYMIHSVVDLWYNQTFIWFFMGFAIVTFSLADAEHSRLKTATVA